MVSKIEKNKLPSKDIVCLKGRFYLQQMIGQGKQGIVYSGVDSLTKKKVAIKFICSKLEEKKKYRNEFKVLKEIVKLEDSKNYPKIFCIEFKKRFYIVTELLGDSLMDIQTKFHAQSGLRIKHVLMIGIQLLDRIRTLHTLGFVHGDIKPANIMFGRGNMKNTLYLIDYGLSKKEDVFLRPSIPQYIYK
mmetsp:Transcript_42829/g.50215  ORF Transcript_42829/g.50215 Transcript_42829/m.50215 type:complete len:189 (-) Transcript_42829:947-1513(-)